MHKPVLLNRIVDVFSYLQSENRKIFADFTVGGGGHSQALLEKFPNVHIVAFDKDDFAIQYTKERLISFDNRITFINDDFVNFDKYIDFKIDGALLDLGISSFQIDDKSRGFSFNSRAKLDMRMNRNSELTAYDVVNNSDFKTLQHIFKTFGEIRMPNRVVKGILKAREIKPIETCDELANIILNCFHTKNRKINPATKFFQALRIYINNELESLEIFLSKIFNFLKVGTRLAVISFHSLEDRIVKKSFKYEALSCVCPEGVLKCSCNKVSRVKIVTKKPIIPDNNEILANKRSRSAKLRIAEKIQE